MKNIYLTVLLFATTTIGFTQIPEIAKSGFSQTVAPESSLKMQETLYRPVAFSRYTSIDGTTYLPDDSAFVTYQHDYQYDKWQYYDWDGAMWNEAYYYVYSYDDHWNWTNVYGEIWTGTEYVYFTQTTNVYDEYDNELSSSYQNWVVDEWVNTYQYLYTYNDDNYEITYIYQTWDGVEWVNNTKIIYNRDADNILQNYIYQTWVATEWVNFSKINYSYLVSGNLESLLYEVWDGVDWVNNIYESYEYDGDNHCTLDESQMWNGSEWVNSSRIVYTYTGAGQLESNTEQYYDAVGEVWVNNYRTVYTYDGSETTSVYQVYYAGDWLNVNQSYHDYLDGVYDYSEYKIWNGTGWDNDYYLRWYYESFEDIAGSTNQNVLKVYPVPFTSTFTIDLPQALNFEPVTIELFDLNGSIVYSKHCVASFNILVDAASIPTGNYIYAISGGHEKYTGNLVKVK